MAMSSPALKVLYDLHVMGLLQPRPEPARAGKFADAKNHLGRNRMGAGQDPVELLPRNSQSPTASLTGNPRTGSTFSRKDFSRMNRGAFQKWALT